MQMDLNDIRSLVTLASFALFVGLMAWTFRPARRGAHEAAARLPFDGEAQDPDNGAAHEPERRAAPSRARSPRGIGRGTPRTRGRQ
jgi:cytochrome c oxidase cbb3-type subunit 4